MSNAIQQIATNMFYQWQSVNATEGVRWIRLLIKPGDEAMLDAFYHYMLGVDIDGEDMIFILQLPFRSIKMFSQDILEFLEEQVEMWNTSSKPEGTPFEEVNWKADYTLQNDDNPAQLAIENLNRLTNSILGAERQKCSFVLHLSNYCDQKELHQWIGNALKLEWHKQMTFTMGEVKGAELLKELERIRPTGEVISIDPDIDMDGAMEEIAQQVIRESSSDDPQEDVYRLALVRLVNSVKKRDRKQTLKEAQNCLDIAVERVKKDPNWIAQVVTVYTILYTDSIGSQNYEDAHYYVDKAIETAQLGIKVLDPSIAYRLLGNAYLGKASIYMPKRRWNEASELYRQGAEAYEVCQDHFMHAEALRMCAGCWEHLGEREKATEVYFEAFSLLGLLAPELVKNSTFPMVLLALTNSPHRTKYISEKELEAKLTEILGANWRDFLYEYKKKLKDPPQTTQEID